MTGRLLTRAEAAEFLALPVATMAAWAYRGTGPRYFKLGRHTRYREGDLLAWLEEHAVETGGRT